MNYVRLLYLAAPEAVVVLTALVVLTFGLLTGRRAAGATVSVGKESIPVRRRAKSSAASVIIAGAGLIAAALVVVRLPAQGNGLDGMLVLSPLNSFFKLIVLVLAFVAVLLTRRGQPNESEYLAMLLLATVGLMLLVASEEFLMIFIGLELTGLSLYVLTGFDKTRRTSAEAGLKYLLFGSTASAFTLFGLSLIYGITGGTSLAAVAERLRTVPLQPLLFAGIVMTLVGFCFKIAAAPFHLWAPDAYQGGPASSAAFIASASKVASFVVLGKILLVGFFPQTGSAAWHGFAGGWQPIVAVVAALSILAGNLAALAQKNVRRLLAYSAVAHAGYTLLGLIAGGREGFSATLFYTTVYAVTLLGAFGVVGFVRQTTGGDNLSEFAGLRVRSPLLAGCMAIFVFSLAGLPPFAGFFGKFYLFATTARAGANHGLLWLVAVALFGSLLSLYYYLLVLKAVFLDAPSSDLSQVPSPARPAFAPVFAVTAMAALVLLFGIVPNCLLAPILAAIR
jgi:NADH-quinone oxidoreductase subunit N